MDFKADSPAAFYKMTAKELLYVPIPRAEGAGRTGRKHGGNKRATCRQASKKGLNRLPGGVCKDSLEKPMRTPWRS